MDRTRGTATATATRHGVGAEPFPGLRVVTLRVEASRASSAAELSVGAWEGFGERSLGRAFEAVAESVPERAALVSASASYRYGDLLLAARVIEERLRGDAAFRAGDRVALLLPNGPEYVAAFYGTLLAGGIVVPIPPDVEPDRLRRLVEISEARLLFTTDAVLKKRPAPGSVEHEALAIDPDPAAGRLEGRNRMTFAGRRAESLSEGGEPAAIFFTSGSTGEPKGVTLSHTNLIANAASIREYLGITADERPLGLLPFYHAFGNSVLQSHLLTGAAIVLAGSLLFPETILEAVREHGVTSLSGVPDVFRTLMARTSLGEIELPSLRYLAVAGGRLDPDQAIVLARRVAPAKLVVMYGQTEATARLSYLPPELLEERFGSIGRGIPGVELQVMGEGGYPVAPGETGEIRARGPNVMLGYWRDPKGTAATVRDGWLYTGDLATVDADGFVYPQGRRNGIVKIAGYRVHPSELEDFVLRELSVLQAVAVDYEAPGIGTRLALFVQPWGADRRVEAEEVRGLCARSLPRHKVPEHVEVLDRFPLNNAYKIDRPALRRRAEGAAPAGLAAN
jgi:acyl-CoA synthetase (AMP-forming)/AMP-acid ligase II